MLAPNSKESLMERYKIARQESMCGTRSIKEADDSLHSLRQLIYDKLDGCEDFLWCLGEMCKSHKRRLDPAVRIFAEEALQKCITTAQLERLLVLVPRNNRLRGGILKTACALAQSKEELARVVTLHLKTA